jgi:hypothetical protein
MSFHILRATRGKYKKPVPILKSGLRFIDDKLNIVKRPKLYPCDHPKHWEWGNGTRNWQKLYYPINEMFYMKWHMTKKEFNQALEAYDMTSLEKKGRVVCANCAKKENKK